MSIREPQKINYPISGLELIASLPLLPAPCSPAFQVIDYFFIWKSLNSVKMNLIPIEKMIATDGKKEKLV